MTDALPGGSAYDHDEGPGPLSRTILTGSWGRRSAIDDHHSSIAPAEAAKTAGTAPADGSSAHDTLGPQIVFTHDADGICTMSEGTGLAALGLQPGQLVGANLFELYRDDEAALIPIRRSLAGETFTYEQEHAGRILWSYHQPLRDAEGRVTGALGLVTDITEMRAAERAAEAYRRRVTTLAELSPQLAREVPDLRSLVLLAVRVATETMAETGALWMVTDDGAALEMKAWHLVRDGVPVTAWHEDHAEPLLIERSTAESLDKVHRIDLGRAAAEGEVYGSQRLTDWVRAAGTGESLRIGLRARGSLVGVLDVSNSAGSGRTFTDEDVALLVEIADRVAMTMDNARLLHRQREVIEQTVRLRALADAAEELIGVSDVDSRLIYANARAKGWMNDAEGTSVWDLLAAGTSPEMASQVRIAVERDGRWSGDLVLHRGTTSAVVSTEVFALAHPDSGMPLGTAWIAQDVTELRDVEATLLRVNADLAQFKALVDASPDFIAMASVDGSVRYVNPPGRRLVGLPEDLDVTTTTIEDYLTAEGLASSRSIEQPAVIEHGHREGESTLRDWRDDSAIPVAIASFLVSDETGAPAVLATVQRDLRERVAAERARQSLAEQREALLSRLVHAQDAERARIAADVHDDSVQALAAVELRLAVLDKQLQERVPELSTVVEPVRASVSAASDRLRALLFDLEPPELDHGLPEALRRAAREVFQDTEIDWDIQAEDCPDVPEAVRAVAYRIAKEAMVNARKHAEAAQVRLGLRERAGGLEVRVSDDGRGMTPGAEEAVPGHLGLSGMRDRAEVAGGSLHVASGQGEGTTVTLWLPAPRGDSVEQGEMAPMY